MTRRAPFLAAIAAEANVAPPRARLATTPRPPGSEADIGVQLEVHGTAGKAQTPPGDGAGHTAPRAGRGVVRGKQRRKEVERHIGVEQPERPPERALSFISDSSPSSIRGEANIVSAEERPQPSRTHTERRDTDGNLTSLQAGETGLPAAARGRRSKAAEPPEEPAQPERADDGPRPRRARAAAPSPDDPSFEAVTAPPPEPAHDAAPDPAPHEVPGVARVRPPVFHPDEGGSERVDAAPVATPVATPRDGVDPTGVLAVAGRLRQLDRAGDAVRPRADHLAGEPTVRIGRIDVVVQAPPPPATPPPDTGGGDVSSRAYLRSL